MERIMLPTSVYPKVKIVHKAKLNRPIFGLVLKNAIYKGFSSNKVKNSYKNSCLERSLNGPNMPILRLIIAFFLFTAITSKSFSQSKIKSADVVIGITNQSGQNPEVVVYPNPFKQVFQVEYNLRKSRSIQLEVLDGMGKRTTGILKRRQAKGKYQHPIQPSNYDIESGMFLIGLVIDGQAYQQRVVGPKEPLILNGTSINGVI